MRPQLGSLGELRKSLRNSESLLLTLEPESDGSYHLRQADRKEILRTLGACKELLFPNRTDDDVVSQISKKSSSKGHSPLESLLGRFIRPEESHKPIRPQDFGLAHLNIFKDGFFEWKKELSRSLFSDARFPRSMSFSELVERFMELFGPPETYEAWENHIRTMISKYGYPEDNLEDDKKPPKRRRLDKGEEEPKALCRELLDWIIALPTDYVFEANFDILRGRSPNDYSLLPSERGSWKHELLWALLEDGQFYNYHGSFLSSLFGSSSPSSSDSEEASGSSWLMTVKSYKKQLELIGKHLPERPKWMRRITESISDVKNPTHKSRLRDLINYVRTIHSVYTRIKKTDFVQGFDVLRGKRDALYYGIPVDALRGVKTTSKYFLHQVLLNSCPELAKAKSVFYSGLLNCTVKALNDFKTNHSDVLEALLPRLKPDDRDPEEIISDPIDESQIDLCDIFITAGEALSLDCFNEKFTGEIRGSNPCGTYSAVTLSHCFSKLKDLLLRSPFALIASKHAGGPSGFYIGRFLILDNSSKGPDAQLKRVMDFMIQGMGFTSGEFFSHVFGSWIKRQRKSRNKEETELLSKSNEALSSELSELSKDFESRYELKSQCPIAFKTFDEKESMSIHIVQDLPWEEVEYLSLAYGSSPDSLIIRNFLSQDSADKFRKEELIPHSKTTQRFSKYSFFNIFCKMILVSSNVEWRSPKCVELFSYIPKFIEEFYDPYLDLSTRIQFLKNALSTLVAQCPHCGKVIESASTKLQRNRLSAHIRKCTLEVTACGCVGIQFKSFSDKKRHLAFVHSGKKYVSCEACDYYTTSDAFMENHVNRNHGKPGENLICSICAGTFRSPYYLSLHMFKHEEHKCEFCGLELVGRNNYKVHKKKVHAAGFKCVHCPKLLDSQWRLEKHIKISHKKFQYQ